MVAAVTAHHGALDRNAALVHALGLVVILFGLSFLFPLAVSHAIADGAEAAYDEAIAITVAAGAGLWFVARKRRGELALRDGFLLVVLAWTGLAGFATLPLPIYVDGLSFTDAYFETMSGLTTTGATTRAVESHVLTSHTPPAGACAAVPLAARSRKEHRK